jgi:hypothetical protein
MRAQPFINPSPDVVGMSSPPLIDQGSGELDIGQLRTEIFPLAGVFTVVSQFILAVGTGIAMYVIARGIQLADA